MDNRLQCLPKEKRECMSMAYGCSLVSKPVAMGPGKYQHLVVLNPPTGLSAVTSANPYDMLTFSSHLWHNSNALSHSINLHGLCNSLSISPSNSSPFGRSCTGRRLAGLASNLGARSRACRLARGTLRETLGYRPSKDSSCSSIAFVNSKAQETVCKAWSIPSVQQSPDSPKETDFVIVERDWPISPKGESEEMDPLEYRFLLMLPTVYRL